MSSLEIIDLCDDDDSTTFGGGGGVARLSAPSPRRRAGKENSRKENKDSKRAAKKRQGTTVQNDFDNFDLTMGVTRTGNALARRERQRLDDAGSWDDASDESGLLFTNPRRRPRKLAPGTGLEDDDDFELLSFEPAAAQMKPPPGNSGSPAKLKPAPGTVAAKPAPVAAVIDVTDPGLVIPPPLTPIEQVLEIFPDVDRTYAQNLLNSNGNNSMTVSALLAESSYPNSKTTFVRDDGITLRRDKRQRKYDFMSTSSFQPSHKYVEEARLKLYDEFPCLSSNGVNKLLNEHGKHYAIAHDAVCSGIMGGPVDGKDADRREEQYRLLKSAMTGVHLTDEQHDRLMVGKRRTTVLHPRRNSRQTVTITDSILREELEYVTQKQGEWMEEVNLRLIRKQNRADAERKGATMECPCCCFDVAVDEMIACREEGHMFCVDCLRRFAENQIFTLGSFGVDRKTKKQATDLLCMHDGCSSAFHVAHLRKALPEKIMAKYDDLQYRAAVGAAGIELFSCPECGIQAEVPETQMIFHCPEASCGHEMCKLCKEPAHIPLKCSEVEKKHETMGRLKVEEAISNAKIRTCPKPGCGKKFIKEDGCNKMTCGCGTLSCYVCRALITKQVGYKHFCQTPHCSHEACNQCPLYSNVEEDDKRAMREAGIEAAEEVRGESLLSASDTSTGVAAALPSEVRVDVDSLLKELPKRKGRIRTGPR